MHFCSDKVRTADIKQHFANFHGDPHSLRDVQMFILDQFESARRQKQKSLFYHYTTAVDTENIRRVFQDCREIILEQNLQTLMMQ